MGAVRKRGTSSQQYAVVPVDGGGYEAVCRAAEPIRIRTVAEMRQKLEREQARRQRDT